MCPDPGWLRSRNSSSNGGSHTLNLLLPIRHVCCFQWPWAGYWVHVCVRLFVCSQWETASFTSKSNYSRWLPLTSTENSPTIFIKTYILFFTSVCVEGISQFMFGWCNVSLVSDFVLCVCEEESVCLCLVISSEGGHSIRSSRVVYLWCVMWYGIKKRKPTLPSSLRW